MSTDLHPIQRDDSGEYVGVVTVSLVAPGRPVVVLDLELIQRLERTLNEVPGDARGLVLASSSERVFVAGADLKSIMAMDDAELAKYLAYGSRVFSMLASFPFPTAAAINGAALGGGLEIAMHCDGLIAAPSARAYPVGLPEAGLCICPGWGGSNMLPARMDPETGIIATATGKPMMFEGAKEAGLFDVVVEDADALLDAAKAWVIGRTTPARDGAPSRWIGRTDVAGEALAALDAVRGECESTGAGRAVCEAIDAGLARGWDAALEVEQRELVRLRHTPEATAAINAFFEKSKR